MCCKIPTNPHVASNKFVNPNQFACSNYPCSETALLHVQTLKIISLTLLNQKSTVKHENQIVTRKHKQSYRHADPRWQQQHTAVAACVTSNHATVTVFVTV